MASKEEKIVFIPLKDIVAETSWNSRSGDITGEGPEEGASYKELFNSIKASGGMNKDPIKVRPKGDKKFSIVYGFSRFSVVSKLADGFVNPGDAKATGDKAKDATIKCVVEELDDLEARAENLRENVSHNTLKGADKAFGLWDLKKQYLAKNVTPTDNQLTDKVGMNQSYGNKLLRIMGAVQPKILDSWRKAPLQLTIPEMLDVAKVDKDRQQEEYDKKLSGKSKERTPQEKSAKQHESDKKTAAKWAAFLGKLEREALISTDNLDFVTHLDFIVKLKSDTPARRAKVAAAAEEAYQKALTEQPGSEAEEEDEDEE